MKKSRTPFYLLIGLLVLAGGGLIWHRHVVQDVPFVPGEKKQIWSIEAKIEFLANNEPVKVSFAIPDSQPGFERLGEHTASPGYGLAFGERDGGRRAEWSVRTANGLQTLYYRVDMLVQPNNLPNEQTPPSLTKGLNGDSGPYVTAARELLQRARARSADNITLARELIREFNASAQEAQFLAQRQTRSAWLVSLLHEAGVPAREVFVLNLEDGRRRQLLNSLIQVFEEGRQYELFNPQSGEQGRKENQILWEYQSGSLLDLVGGSRSSVLFSFIDQEVPLEKGESKAEDLFGFAIHSLPLEEQAMFKGILLIPVGVIVVVFMRIFIGLRTSGTFMPVLIAIAFIQTTLVTGLVGFVIIVSVGLLIRSYLSNLNLLLVARISAVIVTVIIMITSFSIFSFQLGLSEGLKITLFPMIILSWTIERMSILWEEEGPKEVLVQVGGSLSVAVIAYALMMNEFVRHFTFNFLGLQLIMMAIILMMGNYTGYRLFELWRFNAFLGKR